MTHQTEAQVADKEGAETPSGKGGSVSTGAGRLRSAPASRRSTQPSKGKTPTKTRTKKQTLIALLERKGGVEVAAISKSLGWQQHTTRAALTGLRKAGYVLAREETVSGGAGRYRIVGKPAAAGSA